jgi:ABC-2 type transport system permease protein
MMSRIIAVAWRDFRMTVLRKAFLFAIIGLPILIIGVMAVAVWIMVSHEEPPLVGTIVVATDAEDVIDAVRLEFDAERLQEELKEQLQAAKESAEQLMKPGAGGLGGLPTEPFPTGLARGEIRITIEPLLATDDAAVRTQRDRVRDGDVLAMAVVGSDVLAKPGPDAKAPVRFELLVTEKLDADHTSLIERRVGEAIIRVRAKRADLDAEEMIALLKRPRSQTRRVLATGEEASESEDVRELKQLIPMAFMMLIWIATFTAGQHLMMSTIEEKSNRVMEVLLSAVSPLQLMTGKIIGQGGVGLLLLAIYSSLGVGGLLVFAMGHLISIMDLVYLAVYFLMAYFMIASIMAAVGSAVSDIREANTLMAPVMIILMFPLMLWMPIIQAPNGAIATACSFVPPAIPFAMILRLAADEPVPMWQIPVTIVWGYACMLGMIWVAAKIFRVGVLMYGKPPTPLQLLKWMRYS